MTSPASDPLPRESRRIASFCMDGPCNRDLAAARCMEALQWAKKLGEQAVIQQMESWARKRPLGGGLMVKTLIKVARGWHE